MRNYNIEYLEIEYSLMQVFLINIPDNILDISYHSFLKNIEIQVVILEETTIKSTYKKDIEHILEGYTIGINIVFISKEKFNENKGEWLPIYYTWLPNLLFSKAAIL